MAGAGIRLEHSKRYLLLSKRREGCYSFLCEGVYCLVVYLYFFSFSEICVIGGFNLIAPRMERMTVLPSFLFNPLWPMSANPKSLLLVKGIMQLSLPTFMCTEWLEGWRGIHRSMDWGSMKGQGRCEDC